MKGAYFPLQMSVVLVVMETLQRVFLDSVIPAHSPLETVYTIMAMMPTTIDFARIAFSGEFQDSDLTVYKLWHALAGPLSTILDT